jgi:putative SOS response-associated peptidase YedK
VCNGARNRAEPKTLFERFGANWAAPRPMDNRFNPVELTPRSRAYVVRQNDRGRGIDIKSWDVLGAFATWPMTNVRNLSLPQWRKLAERPENRCLVPLTEFCEFTPEKHDLGDGKPPLKGEMWFEVTDQQLFAVAGFWQETAKGRAFTMVNLRSERACRADPP